MVNPLLRAKERALAKITLAAALALAVLAFLLPFLLAQAPLPLAFFLLWGLFLLLIAVIVGISVTYVFLTRELSAGEPSPLRQGGSDDSSSNAHEALQSVGVPGVPQDGDRIARLLARDEQVLYRRIAESGGVVLQKDLVAWGAFSGPKLSRLLDRLAAKGLVRRERHGMTNQVRIVDVPRDRT